MTPDDIRNRYRSGDNMRPEFYLVEIAAQLAELNDNLRFSQERLRDELQNLNSNISGLKRCL